SGSSSSKPVMSLTEDEDSNSDSSAETDAVASEIGSSEIEANIGTRARSTRTRDPNAETDAEAVAEASETGSKIEAN
ncbi:hypothetical protein A2U01_0098326, partial [Trifolium medium]|nr:hypothetical protein [Trifolium medium]